MGSAGIQAANRLLGLALAIILARGLGAEGYGTYAYAFALMSLLMVLAEAGIPKWLLRETAARQGRSEWAVLRTGLSHAVWIVSLIATVVCLGGLFLLWYLADELSPAMFYTTALMLIVLPLAALRKTLAYGMQGLHRVIAGKAVELLIRPLLMLGVVGAGFLAWPELREPYYAMAAELLVAVMGLLLAFWFIRRFLPPSSKQDAPESGSRTWLRSAAAFTLIGGAAVINYRADILMLGGLASVEDVGVYRVAVQGAVLVTFGLQAVNAVVAPQFARLHAQGDGERLRRLVTQSVWAGLLSAVPVALVLMLAGESIIGWVFGAAFIPAYAPLAILAVGQLANAAFGIMGFLLNMTGHEGAVASVVWKIAIMNIVLNAILIPPYGMSGAAMATALSIAAWKGFLYRRARKELPL